MRPSITHTGHVSLRCAWEGGNGGGCEDLPVLDPHDVLRRSVATNSLLTTSSDKDRDCAASKLQATRQDEPTVTPNDH